MSLLEQLRFLGRVRVCSPEQFAVAFEHDVWWAYKRIARLCTEGLADRARPLRHLPTAVWATPDGLAAAGLARSKRPKLSLDRLGHDLAATQLLLELEGGAGARVFSERELRREECGSGLVSIGRARHGDDMTHCPDLAIVSGRQRWALELEFSPKGSQRLRGILTGYRRSDYAGVVYYVRDPALARSLSRLSLDCGLNERLSLRAWELWPEPSTQCAEVDHVASRHRELALASSGASFATRVERENSVAESPAPERRAAIEAWERRLHDHDAGLPDGRRCLLRGAGRNGRD